MREYSALQGFDEAALLAAVRAEQAAVVMPLVGPLLDAWDQVPRALKAQLRVLGLGKRLDLIEAAASGDCGVRREVPHGRA